MYIIKNSIKLERFYNSLVKKMEKLGTKQNVTYDDALKIQELSDIVDKFEKFFIEKPAKKTATS